MTDRCSWVLQSDIDVAWYATHRSDDCQDTATTGCLLDCQRCRP